MAGTPTKTFNPGFRSEDELIRSFCVRTGEFDSIIETLRESGGGSNRHTLVIGSRGSGKTTLGLRVAAECRGKKALSSNWFPIPFAEKSYEKVSTCGEFWLECLGRLAERMPSLGATDLRRNYEDLRAVQDDRLLADRCLGSLMDFANRQDKRLLLLVENLDLMFTQLENRHDFGSRLRHTLQNEPKIFVLATATSRLGEEIVNPDSALYGLFRVLRLRRLTVHECGTLWKSISGRQAESGNVSRLQILTGGNPRLLAVAAFGSSLSVDQSIDKLLDLIAEHFEYFESSVKELAPEEQRIYRALASIWRPATTCEIADQAQLPTNDCSEQLERLVERGTVATVGKESHRKQYYLKDRLFNISYIFRQPASESALPSALIAFLKAFYSKMTLTDTDVSSHLTTETNRSNTPNYSHKTEHIRKTLETRIASSQVSRLSPQNLLPSANELFFCEEYSLAIEDYNSVLNLCEMNSPSEDMELVKIKTSLFKADSFLRTKQFAESLNKFDEIVRKVDEIARQDSTDFSSKFQVMVLHALVGKGCSLFQLGKPEDALLACKEALRLSESAATDVRIRITAMALFEQGVHLEELNRLDESKAALSKLTDSKDSNNLAIREWIVKGLVIRARILIKLDHPSEALGHLERVQKLLHEHECPKLSDWQTQALWLQADALKSLGQKEQPLTIYGSVLDRLETRYDPIAVKAYIYVLFTMGNELFELERYAEAIQAYDNLATRCSEENSPDLNAGWALGLYRKALVLTAAKKHKEALAVCDDVLTRFGTTSDASDIVNDTLFLRVNLYFWIGKKSTCLKELARIISHLPSISSNLKAVIMYLKEFTIDFGSARILDLIEESPAEEILLPFVIALRRELGIEAPVEQEVEQIAQDIQADLASLRCERNAAKLLDEVVKPLCSQAQKLFESERYEEAIQAYDELVVRCAEIRSQDPRALLAIVTSTSGFVMKSLALSRLGKDNEVLHVCKEVLLTSFEISNASEAESIYLQKASILFGEALLIQARALHRLGRIEESLPICDEIVRRFGTCDEPDFVELVRRALLFKGAVLDVCDEVLLTPFGISNVSKAESIYLQKSSILFGEVLLIQAKALQRLSRIEEALQICDEIVGRFGTCDEPDFVELVRRALLFQGNELFQLERFEAVIQTVNYLLERLPMDAGPQSFAYWIRAESYWMIGNESAFLNDVVSFIDLLPAISSLDLKNGPEIGALESLTVGLGLARTLDLIEGSPAKGLLLPFSTALRRELGIETRVAQEVEEVAKDIQADLKDIQADRAAHVTHEGHA